MSSVEEAPSGHRSLPSTRASLMPDYRLGLCRSQSPVARRWTVSIESAPHMLLQVTGHRKEQLRTSLAFQPASAWCPSPSSASPPVSNVHGHA